MSVHKFKSPVDIQSDIKLSQETAERALQTDASGNIESSSVTNTELGHLSGVTGPVQTQINDAQADATQALADAAAAQADATQALSDAADAQADATQALADAAAAQADATQALTDISNHLSDSEDAHDASAISIVDASSQFTSTNVEGALDEAMDAAQAAQADATQALSDAADAQADVDDLITLSGVAANSTDLGTFTGSLIPDNSDIKEALQALESEIEAIPSPFFYAGTWAASTNTPSLADGVGTSGAVYYVTDSGTVDFGSGNISFSAGDKVAYNGATWDKWDMTDQVASVFGRTGAVTAQSGDYTASQITNVPAGTIAATDVQGAINELEGDVVAAQADATQALADAAAAQADIDNHIADTADAHDASAISVVPTGNLAATDVQAALDELQGDADSLDSRLDAVEPDVADLITLSGVAANSTDLGTFTGAIIPDSSTIKGALQSLETELESMVSGSAGDIPEASFSMANNQASAANVTGLAFAAGVVRSFKALVSVEIDATADLYETFELVGINKGGSFDMAITAVGDNSLVVFTITSGGQVQYTSGNYAGFVSGAIKFRASTTTV
jgi:hypothetical protein